MRKISVVLVGLVLIETYWNVKVVAAQPDPNCPGINRNILECKDQIT